MQCRNVSLRADGPGAQPIHIVVNYAPRDDRVSIKLVVNRDKQDAPTPVFDSIKQQFEPERGA